MKRLLLISFTLIAATATAQNVTLLRDINTTVNAESSSPSSFAINTNGTIFFAARDQERGMELWTTDGTGAGTVLIKDINEGSGDSDPSNLTANGTIIYFSATDALHGTELWRTDGTPAGTYMVEDIYLGTSSSFPANFVVMGGNLYFSADDGIDGEELWKSGGDAGNTAMLTDIYDGPTDSNPTFLTATQTAVYFRADHPSYGEELWRTTSGNPATLVMDIYPGTTDSDITGITAVNAASSNTIVFSAETSANGQELWRSAGSSLSTSVIDIYHFLDNTGDSSPSDFVSSGGTVYFSATAWGLPASRRLYKTTGAAGNYTLIPASGAADEYYEPLGTVYAGGILYFSAENASGDRELYTSNGTNVFFEGQIDGSGSSSPGNFAVAGSVVYFAATTVSFGREFYTSNGTTISLLANINTTPATSDSSSPSNINFLGGKVYFSAFRGSDGRELWMYNGTSTSLLKDINGGSEDSNPNTFVSNGVSLFFSATSGTGGTELWTTNGLTGSGNTYQVAEIGAGTTGSSALPILYNNSLIFFSANNGTNGTELYKSTGASGNSSLIDINTTAGASSSPLVGAAALGTFIYFSAEADAATTGREVYRSDGTTTSLVANINSGAGLDSNPSNFTTFGSFVYFTATDATDGTELWRTNGSTTSKIGDINIAGSSSPNTLTVMGSFLYFVCDDGANGTEIYRTNGNVGHYERVTQINPGGGSANPQFLTVVSVSGTDRLFFRAIDGTNGTELWVSDGAALGVVGTNHKMVKNIHPSAGSDPSNLTVGISGSTPTLYFTATDLSYGTELYKVTGGTAINAYDASLVKDIYTGTTSSSPANLKSINGTVYFRASDGTGSNLMKTNGTSAGTILATSAGQTFTGASNINYLSAQAKVYFVGETNTSGTEILYLDAEPANQPTVLNLTVTSSTQIGGSFTAAAGAEGYLVVRNAGNAPTGVPIDGATAYVAGNTFLTGTGTVVQQGSGNTFSASGLTAGTQYYFSIFSYVHDGAVYIYRPYSPLTSNATTLAAEPTTQASLAAPGSITQTSMTLTWTGGNGAESIVLAQATSAVTGVPVDGTTYTASSVFTSGSSSSISGAKVIYRGSGNLVTVTSLSPGTAYHFRLFELSGSGAQTNYLITTPPATNATTLALNGNQPTNLQIAGISHNAMTLTWGVATAPATEGYIVMRKIGSDPTDVPTPSTQFTAGQTIGTSTVAYVDTGEGLSAALSGLTSASNYFFRVYAYTGSDASPTYVVSDPLVGNQTTFDTQPLNGPTSPLSLINPSSTSLSGAFAAATGSPAPAGYLVLQKQSGVVSPDAPADGESYVVGNTIGGSTVVFIGVSVPTVGSPFLSEDLEPSTTYHYSAFSFRGSGATINYHPTPITNNRTTLVEEPLDQPSAFVFGNPATTSVDVSFTAAPTEPDGGYIVVRRESAAVSIPNIPADGTAYAVGNSLGSLTVVAYIGTANSFHDTGLTPNTTYHYAAAAYNGSGDATNYLLAGGPAGNVSTLPSEPAGQPTAIQFANRTSTSIDVSFTAPAGPPAGYIVLRISAPAAAELPLDGATYIDGDLIGIDEVVYVGSAPSFTDTDLAEATQYHYAVFSFNGTTGTYNFLATSPLEGSAFTLAEEPTADMPTNLAFADPTTSSMTVAWEEAAAIPGGYIVFRQAGTAPTAAPLDGTGYTVGQTLTGATVVHVGPNLSFSSTGLAAGTIYHYKVVTFNGSGTSSNYQTTAIPLTGNRTTLNAEPTAQPTTLVFSNKSTSSVQLNFTLAVGTNRYIIIRRAGSPPTEVPVDGVGYTDNSVFGSSVVTLTSNAAGIPFTDGTGLAATMAAGTTYYYSIFSFNGVSGANNYLTTSPLTGSIDILALAPSAQPSGLTFSNVTSTSLTGSFTAAAGAPSGYVVVRRAGAAPTGLPATGVAYNVGDGLGDGTVVHAGSTVTFNDSGLSPEVNYHYRVYSFNGAGGSTNYITSTPLAGNQVLFATEPAQPTGFATNTVGANSLSFSFTLSDAQHYLILRKATSAPSEVPIDGTAYSAGALLGASTVVLAGNIGTFPMAESGLAAGTVYHYAIFGFNGAAPATNNYNTTSPLTAITGTLSSEPGAQPTALTFSAVTATSVTGTFTAASGSPDGYLVLRRQDGIPNTAPADGTAYAVGNVLGNAVVVHSGSALTFNDSGLNPEKVHHYQVFAYIGSGPTINYLTTGPATNSFTTFSAEPAQPTALTPVGVNPTSLSFNFTVSDAQHYLILRKVGSAPTEVPVDGVAYATGATLGTSAIVLAGNVTLPLGESTLLPGTVYHYAIFGYNGATPATYNYNTASPLTAVITTLAAKPTAQPTNVTFTSVGTETMTVSFLPPATAPGGYLVVRREGSAPTGVPADGTTYAAGDALGNGVVAYAGTALNFAETALIGETEYFYQVFAFNGTGATTSYLTTTPASGHQLMFAWEPSNQPTNLVFTNLTASGFTVSFTPDPDDFASGHVVLRKIGGFPSVTPVDGTTYVIGNIIGDAVVAYVGPASTFNETVSIAAYHYAVYAYNGDIAAATNYKLASPLTGTLLLDTTPPTFTNNTAATIVSGLPLKVSLKVTDTESGLTGPVTLEFRPLTSAATTFTTRTMNLVSGNFEADVTAAEVGEQGLIFRVKATNGNGSQGTSANFKCLVSFSSLSLPEVPAAGDQSDYRLIAVPLALTNKKGDAVFSVLGPSEGGKNWRMYEFQNGGTKNTEITNLANVSVEPGKGYWLISKTAVAVNVGGGIAVDVTDTAPFTINLVSGWNLIGNPYLFNVSWGDVNTANSTQLQLKTYRSKFDISATLNKFEGAFVSAGSSIALKIPPSAKATSREEAPKPKINAIDSDNWEVILSLRSDDETNPFGGVGMSRNANVGYDYFDDFTVPRLFNFLELNHNKRIYGMTYTKDILPVTESQTWEFSVDANSTGTTEMNWDNSYFGNNDLQLVLWDEEEQKAVDMRKENAYTFNQGMSRKFRIFFGNQAYVDDKIEASSLRLHSISPNPSHSDVKVAFSLPGKESSHVKVRLVNNLGQQVVNIFEGQLEAGYHEVMWSGKEANGERPAEGVYVVEVISGDLRESKRLVIK